MGVYKRIETVPERYRLRNFQSRFLDRDVWGEWVGHHADPDWSDRTDYEYERVEDSWKEHMRDRDRHHALAVPDDVEQWVSYLLEGQEYAVETAYDRWWSRLNQFYEWLQYHVEYPHVYNPVWMAAATEPNSRKMWERKMARTRKCEDE